MSCSPKRTVQRLATRDEGLGRRDVLIADPEAKEADQPILAQLLVKAERERGWQVPAYTMPPDADDIAVLRVVVREGFSRDLADMFVEDLQRAADHFEGRPAVAKKKSTVFSH